MKGKFAPLPRLEWVAPGNIGDNITFLSIMNETVIALDLSGFPLYRN